MDAKEILSKHTGETGIYLTKGQIRGSDAIEAMEEYATLRTQSLQDKVKELESELTKFTEVSNKHINDLDSLIVELQSALTESKLREERLREELLKKNDYTPEDIKNLLSSNQAEKDRSLEFTHCPNCTTKPQCATQKQCNLINH